MEYFFCPEGESEEIERETATPCAEDIDVASLFGSSNPSVACVASVLPCVLGTMHFEGASPRCFECPELLFAVTEAAQPYRARHTPKDQARGDIFLSGPVKICACAVDEDQWYAAWPHTVWNGAPPARSKPGVVNKRQPSIRQTNCRSHGSSNHPERHAELRVRPTFSSPRPSDQNRRT